MIVHARSSFYLRITNMPFEVSPEGDTANKFGFQVLPKQNKYDVCLL
jgi:hypothetical protein